MVIKVLLADDSALIRKAIGRLLQQEPKIELIGEAADFAQTLTLAGELKPNVVLLDLHMPNVEGFTTLRVRNALMSSADSVLAISLRKDEETLALAEEFGATCLLDKMELADKLIPAIIRVSATEKHPIGHQHTATRTGVPPCEA
ncbi:MAG: hypothetical protein NVS9B4_26220 [Candidatus Acidiferrum sp.]